MLLEALFKNGRLVLGEPELLSRSLSVFFIADSSRASSLDLVLVLVAINGFSLAPLPAHARDRAVRRRHAGLVLAVRCCRRRPVDVDSPEERSGLDPTHVGAPICTCEINGLGQDNPSDNRSIWISKVQIALKGFKGFRSEKLRKDVQKRKQ